MLYNRRPELKREDIEIRPETEKDYFGTEEMTMRAFWNKHHKGCNEHFLVHKLRTSGDYLPGLSRIAVRDGRVIGGIFYSRAWLKKDDRSMEILTFGPLCVEPAWQGCGVGRLLLEETMALAKQAGYPGIVIFGEPDYYPHRGFVTCDKLGITTAEGKNSDAFMGCELFPGALKAFGGSFYESEIFEQLSPEETEIFSAQFPPLRKQYFPMQW
ncbi:MAG: N-acetyltransferase [Acetatifactor sp.]|nr:N-acetyltransferase [Acetatifactor sp.]MDE7354545.1 N-acetyltransferase [Acetatifactor sp.]